MVNYCDLQVFLDNFSKDLAHPPADSTEFSYRVSCQTFTLFLKEKGKKLKENSEFDFKFIVNGFVSHSEIIN